MIKLENLSGNMLMNSELRNMVCVSKKGYLIPIKLGVRINVMVDNGIQFCGVMNFHKAASETCLLVVNKFGKILEFTEAGSRFFIKGRNINKHNRSFSNILKVSLILNILTFVKLI